MNINFLIIINLNFMECLADLYNQTALSLLIKMKKIRCSDEK